VPTVKVKFWLAARVTPPLAVIRPEIVGVAVQAVEFTVRVTPALPSAIAVALVTPKFNWAAESIAVVPEVAVSMVRLPEVLVIDDVPPSSPSE